MIRKYRPSSVAIQTVDTVPSYKPRVFESEETLTLHFTALDVQSEMAKESPNVLTLGYTQAMMGFLLLHPEPQDILIVGLGGGSLSKYCYHTLPNTRITTVEVNSDVIALRDRFCIPADNDRFKVIQDNAAHFMKGKDAIADIIMLDGYDDDGIPRELATEDFYLNCRKALRNHGMLVSNFNCSEFELEEYIRLFTEVFGGRVMEADAVTSYNSILFGLKSAKSLSLQTMLDQALQRKKESGIDYPRFLKQMWTSAKRRAHMNSMLSL